MSNAVVTGAAGPDVATTEPCCVTGSSSVLPEDRADALAGRLKALADPARLRLLSLVATHVDREACVCELTDPVGLSQPTVSHHLKVLVESGFLSRTRRGRWAYYALTPGALEEIAGQLALRPQ